MKSVRNLYKIGIGPSSSHTMGPAFAVCEQNADCGLIVTAPTCGACGVLPAVLKYMQEKNGFTGKDMSGLYRETSEGGLAKLYVHK